MLTYLTFHLFFILPAIVLLWLLYRPGRQVWAGIGAIGAIAFVYATPWDNWLVAEGIWTYGPERVLATIGHVPVEEYAFFLLQPILTGFWLSRFPLQLTTPQPNRVRPVVVLLAMLVTGVSAVALLAGAGSTRYLAMILVWAAPVIALQWGVGGDVLWRNRRVLVWAILPPTLYLALVDRIAIGAGVWHTVEATSLESLMIAGLPLEEGFFFFITNVMVVQGIVLFHWARAVDLLGQIKRMVAAMRPITPPVAPLHPSESARRVIVRRLIWPVYAVLALLLMPFLLGVEVPLSVQLIPLAVSVVAFGLPHGAVDHLVPFRVLRQSPTPRRMTAFLLAYILPVGVVLALWFVFPLGAFVFFILMTWWHWGLGDLHAVLAFHRADFIASRGTQIMTAVLRGALPMLVPLLAFPLDYRLALESITGAFGAAGIGSLEVLFTASFRLVLAGVLFNLASFTLLATFSDAMEQDAGLAWAITAGEVALLFAFFALVPPFLAIGLYFCLWHSLRHIARLMLLDEPARESLQAGRMVPALARFGRLAAPLTVVALGFLAGLYWLVPARPDDLLAGVGLYLALIAALTLPHTLLVMWLDASQRLWQTSASPAPVYRGDSSPANIPNL